LWVRLFSGYFICGFKSPEKRHTTDKPDSHPACITPHGSQTSRRKLPRGGS
jgi:hypothetical protein